MVLTTNKKKKIMPQKNQHVTFCLACSAGVFFGSTNVFARESAMLKLPEDRRKWGESKRAGREKSFFSLSPPPFPSFALAPTLRVAISTLPNLPMS